jgi:putative redox protein
MAWRGGSHVAVRVRDFEPLVLDEPPHVGGTNRGPRPTEYLLAAYLGCTAIITHQVATDMSFSYSALEGEAVGELDPRGVAGVDGVKPEFEWVTCRLRVATPESPARVEELSTAVARRCPLRSTLAKAGIQVTEDWTIVTAPSGADGQEQGKRASSGAVRLDQRET